MENKANLIYVGKFNQKQMDNKEDQRALDKIQQEHGLDKRAYSPVKNWRGDTVGVEYWVGTEEGIADFNKDRFK